ncbi:MAG: HipA N-terminal domain-containing protein [Flavitalea sp.]
MKGEVYHNGVLAGILEKRSPEDYRFVYAESYLADPDQPSISLTLPKTRAEHAATILFPFFAGLLTEGINKEIQCRILKIDENDDFTRLLKTAAEDTIGGITVQEIPE